MSPAEKPEQDVQTGVDGDGRGLSLQCVCPGMPLRLAANLSHRAWAGDPAVETKNLPELRLEASAPGSVHKPYRRGSELVSLLHRACFLSYPVVARCLLSALGRHRRGLGQSLTSGSELTQARGAGTPSQVPSIHPP